MLVLNRWGNESIHIPEFEIKFVVLGVTPSGRVRIGIEAPEGVNVFRGELVGDKREPKRKTTKAIPAARPQVDGATEGSTGGYTEGLHARVKGRASRTSDRHRQDRGVHAAAKAGSEDASGGSTLGTCRPDRPLNPKIPRG